MMKNITSRLLIAVLALAGLATVAFAQPRRIITQGLNITAPGNVVFSADTIYQVSGFINVGPGASLRIPAGTRIECVPGSLGSIQTLRSDTVGGTIRPSGVLIMEGTAQRPIVFTSTSPEGSKTRGQAGGIIMNGTARNNVPGGTRLGEGGAGPGGGQNDADSSGSLRYVRVEFGGIILAPGNEINGFTFNSVGSRTRLEFLQAHFIADDAFEWFGGTCDARFLLATGCDDDQIDTEFGYRGRLQFVAAVEADDLGNRGYESNNDGAGTSFTPFTKYTAYNVTLVGLGRRNPPSGEINDGIYLRANVGGLHYNHLVVNFGGAGVVIDGNAARDNLYAPLTADSALAVRNSIFWVRNDSANQTTTNPLGNALWAIRRGTGIATNDTTGLFPLYAASSGNRVVDPQLRRINLARPIDSVGLDLRPAVGSPALTGGATPPNDGFFDPTATFIGAFGATDWTAGWANYRRGASPLAIREDLSRPVARDFTLDQNYPNPFNPSTTIRFALPTSQLVTLKVYDVLGREVATLVNNERLGAGNYTYQFNAANLATGTYLYRLQAGTFVESRKMTLVK